MTDIYEKLDAKLDKLTDKVDSLGKDTSEMKATMVGQAGTLSEHIRRTQLAEENIEMIRKDVEPIKAHVLMMKGGAKFAAAVCGGAVALTAVVEMLLKIFRG